uniref:Uncharacterized protein n=1 Tax=viral metagenome TaxID=1070528 RepID=A0A6C0ADA7_9ZZZZ
MKEENFKIGISCLILGIIILIISVLIQVQVIKYDDPNAWYWYLLDIIGIILIFSF